MKLTDQIQLSALYPEPSDRAKGKVLSALDKHSKNFISKSPFLVLSSASLDFKMDASPRGGKPGFVYVRDDKTIVIPDAKGNNRTDSIKNIIETSQVGLLFMIPGIDETLRLNGTAFVSPDKEFINYFPNENIQPKACIVITISEVFMHCAKAFMRSEFWNPEMQINRKDFPTMGEILKDQLKSKDDPETHNDMVKRYSKDL